MPRTRRYTDVEKAQAVRLVRQARAGGRESGVILRVARQLGYGVESVRMWVKDADVADGTAGPDAQRRAELGAQNRELVSELWELRRANEMLKRASAFFAAELDRPQK
jgi:transposase